MMSVSLTDNADDLIGWWFSGTSSQKNDRWFKKSQVVDEYVKLHYKPMLEKVEQTSVINMLPHYTIREHLFLILLLDQVSRHVYRDNRAKVEQNTSIAVHISLHVLKCLEMSDEIDDESLIFILMPLKHHNIVNYFEKINDTIHNYSVSNGTGTQIMRFRRDSLRKYLIAFNAITVMFPNLYVDRYKKEYIRIIYNEYFTVFNVISLIIVSLIIVSLYANFIDPLLWLSSCITICILFFKFVYHERYETVCEYLPEDNFIDSLDDYCSDILKHDVYIEMLKRVRALIHLNHGRDVTITVSLSGGVDSMVSLYCLYVILKETDLKFRLNAVHINYKNRVESDMEQHFVEECCMTLQVPLYIRTIDQIKRKDGYVTREWYEDVTRDIRYDLYKRLSNTNNGPTYIVLGHIKDDTIENIFTNLSKGRHIFDLKKLKVHDEMYNVNIFRPFIKVFKDRIEHFAGTYGIPWLINTTPVWSNRGRMRNEFIPAYERQFGKESYNQLDFVCKTLKQYSELMDILRNIIVSDTTHNKYGTRTRLKKQEHLELGCHFWMTVLKDILHPRGISLPSKKSVEHFIQTIRSNKSTNIQLKKGIYCYFDSRTLDIYVLNAEDISSVLNVPQNKLSKDHWKSIRPLLE